MATFSLVHGAWGGGWLWDLLRAELESRGHVVHAPDLPCEDVAAGVAEYAAAVPAADVVVGYSLGGLTIPVRRGGHARLPDGPRRRYGLGRRLRQRVRRRARPRRARPLVLPRPRRRGPRAADPARARAPCRQAPPSGAVRRYARARRAAGLHRLHAGRRHPPGVAAASRPGRPRRRAARARRGPLPDARVPAGARGCCSTRSSRRRGAALRSGGASRGRSAGAAPSRPVAPPAFRVVGV